MRLVDGDDVRLAAIKPSVVRRYLSNNDWEEDQSDHQRLVVFLGPIDDEGERIQLPLPKEDGVLDARQRVAEAVDVIATLGKLTADEVIELLRLEDGATAPQVMIDKPAQPVKARAIWFELSVGQVTECIVNKTIKGGLAVTVGGLRAFLPASQVDLNFVSSMESLVGQKLTVQITELNPAKRTLVVSRRSVMLAERKGLAGAFWEKVEVGQQFTGTVKTIKDYGVNGTAVGITI